MGLFDSLFGSSESSSGMTPQEAFAGILLAASACDGHISEDEAGNLTTALGRMKLFQRTNDKQFRQVIDKGLGLLKKKGHETLLETASKSLPKELRIPAFANACNIVLADGSVDADEKQLIDTLQVRLDIEPSTAKMIVQVMVIKNKG